VTREWTENPLEVPLVGGLQQTMPAFPGECCQATPEPHDLDLSGLEAACRNWLALPADVHGPVTAALTQLNESKKLTSLDAAFTILAAALEQLLLDPDKDRSVGFKVASRLARCLERDPDRRQQVIATAHEFYGHLGPDMRGHSLCGRGRIPSIRVGDRFRRDRMPKPGGRQPQPGRAKHAARRPCAAAGWAPLRPSYHLDPPRDP